MNKAIEFINKEFPEVNDPDISFANGKYCIQRTEGWLENFKALVLDAIQHNHIIKFKPFSYGWYRTLDDGNSPFYRIALRATYVCPTCFKEWGQAYYANNCNHKNPIEKQEKTLNFRRG
jgi:hypothetical protein